jgi:hypothetical protein
MTSAAFSRLRRFFVERSAGSQGRHPSRGYLGHPDAGYFGRHTPHLTAARKVSGLFAAVVDADLAGPMPWLAAAYVAGPSLTEAVGRHGQLPVPPGRDAGSGTIGGFGAIHVAGMAYWDLKPSNVLLADGGRMVIGSCRHRGRLPGAAGGDDRARA